jgi:murein DD-endopeptidase MepM/ murein hydrolase activator NlpD
MFQAVPRASRPALLIVCFLTAFAAAGAGAAADGSCSPDASACTTTGATTTPTETTPTATETTSTGTTSTTTADPDDLVPSRRGSTSVAPPEEPKRAKAAKPSADTQAIPAPTGLGPQLVTPALGGGPYVFPVYGPVQFSDTFGAARADVSWHHGDDIFAPLGSPILAVADGTLFSVGWNQIGGNRIWLRDREGNYFYYAHLAAFSTLAVDGAEVRAGDVIGFVGNTGDAAGTPYHLHFEIHPVAMLGFGYDGAVNPTSYLLAWQRLQDVRFDAVYGWTPANAANRPKAGAILLQSSDISSASGLDPGSIDRALAPVTTEGAGGLLLPQAQQPSAKPVAGSGP